MLGNRIHDFGNTVTRVVLVLFVLCSFSFAMEMQDVDLEKKYADIIGKWELDLTDAGMGILPVEFYVENGAIWVIPADDPPLKLVLIEGEEWKFEVDDGDSIWRLEFIKDDNAKYHKCKVINEAEGIDTTGIKK
jgi:hypothetical protein